MLQPAGGAYKKLPFFCTILGDFKHNTDSMFGFGDDSFGGSKSRHGRKRGGNAHGGGRSRSRGPSGAFRFSNSKVAMKGAFQQNYSKGLFSFCRICICWHLPDLRPEPCNCGC